MAAKRRHWKEKDGRYWARISIPLALKPFFADKTQLTEPPGGDLRIADENHAAAVARLQDKLKAARRMLEAASSDAPVEPAPVAAVTPRRALTPEDVEPAIWAHDTTRSRKTRRNGLQCRPSRRSRTSLKRRTSAPRLPPATRDW